MPEFKVRIAVIILGFVILALDLATKWWVTETSALWNYPVIDGFFKLHYVRNEGIAFGFFHDLESQWKPVVLSAMSVVAVLIVLFYIWQTPPSHRLLLAALGLLLGGILGNFIDRLFNEYVTDFIELHWRDAFIWPTFNVADAAITSGVFLILLDTFWGNGSPDPQQDGDAESSNSVSPQPSPESPIEQGTDQ